MNQAKNPMSPRTISIIILTVATAIIHIGLAFYAMSLGDMTTLAMFLLNGIGYLILLAVGWVAFGARNGIAYIDKLIEVVLIVLLLTDRS
jgi:hypothetical protein